jgi:hypothetical protein
MSHHSFYALQSTCCSSFDSLGHGTSIGLALPGHWALRDIPIMKSAQVFNEVITPREANVAFSCTALDRTVNGLWVMNATFMTLHICMSSE